MSVSITVYLSSATGIDRKYLSLAHDVGAMIASRGWTTVYGGNHVGPMGALADGARSKRGRVVGITPKNFHDDGVADLKCDELLVVDSMRTRKQRLEERGDAFLILPGGIGTLEEMTEILVGRQLNFHAKPIVLLNFEGFWDSLLALFRQGMETGFYRPMTMELFDVAASVAQAGDQLALRLGTRLGA
jgi:uncharacterized protein (TIGR00730 family)